MEFSENGLSIPGNLVSVIKQALLAYAEETEPYYLVRSTHYNAVVPSTFLSNQQYQDYLAFCKEHPVVFAKISGNNLVLVSFDNFYDDGYAFIQRSIKTFSDGGREYYADVCDRNWQMYPMFTVYIYYYDSGTGERVEIKEQDQSLTGKYSWMLMNPPGILTSSSTIGMFTHGGTFKLFKSLNDYKNYSAGSRKVYFGSGFYDKEPGEIKVTFDELEDYLDGRYDDCFDRLKDLIGGEDLSEEALEKLVDKLLGQIKDTGGEVTDNQQQANTLLQKILETLQQLDRTVETGFAGLSGLAPDTSGIEMYLEEILQALGFISWQLEDMTTEKVEEETDSLVDSLFSAFSEIGDVMKRKFPFSIPFDLHGVLSFLGGIGTASESSAAQLLAGPEPASYPASGQGAFYVQMQEEAHSPPSGTGAPRFELPFVIGSAGLEAVLVIDLQHFDTLSHISRTMFSCLFVLVLINLTLKLMDVSNVI